MMLFRSGSLLEFCPCSYYRSLCEMSPLSYDVVIVVERKAERRGSTHEVLLDSDRMTIVVEFEVVVEVSSDKKEFIDSDETSPVDESKLGIDFDSNKLLGGLVSVNVLDELVVVSDGFCGVDSLENKEENFQVLGDNKLFFGVVAAVCCWVVVVVVTVIVIVVVVVVFVGEEGERDEEEP